MWSDDDSRDYYDDYEDYDDEDIITYTDYIALKGPAHHLEEVVGNHAKKDSDAVLEALEQMQKEASRGEKVADHLARFADGGKFSDVVLQVGSRAFRAHKLVLCSWSEVFHKMFLDPSWTAAAGRGQSESESRGPEVQELVEPEECLEVFDLFLRFMYTESVGLSGENVYPLLALADKYLVQELRDACEDFLVEWIGEAGGGEEVGQHYGELERRGLERGQRQCVAVLGAHFGQLTEACLASMPYSLLSRLLDSSCLAVDGEREVFEMAMRWLTAPGRCEERRQHAAEVLSQIRFPHVPAGQLKALLECGLPDQLVEADLRPELERLVAKAFQWRALAAEKAYSSMDGDYVQPRLYFDQSFSTSVNDVIPRNTITSNGFYKFQIEYETSMYGSSQEIYVARLEEGKTYQYGRFSWRLTAKARQLEKHEQQQQHQQSQAAELWALTYTVQTRQDLGANFRAAIKCLTEDPEEGSGKPSVTVHQGKVQSSFHLEVPPAVLRLTKKPSKVWAKIAVFVEGKVTSPSR